MQLVPGRHLSSNQFPGIDESSRRYRALLHAADLAANRAFPELLQQLSGLLHELFEFNFLNYALRDDAADLMRLYMIDEAISPPEKPLEFLIEESPAGWGWSNQQPLLISDLKVEKRFRPVLDLYENLQFRSLIVLPMTTARRRLGTLSFGSKHSLHCDAEVVHFLERLTGLVALALENSLSMEVSRLQNAAAVEQQQIHDLASALSRLSDRNTEAYENLRKERERLEVIVEILAGIAASRLDLRQMFPAISKSLQKAIPHDALAATVLDSDERYYDIYAVESQSSSVACLQGTRIRREETLSNLVFERGTDGEIIRCDEVESYKSQFPTLRRAWDAGLVSWCIVPMRTPDHFVGTFCVGGRSRDAFSQTHLELLKQLATAMAFFIESAQIRSAVESEKNFLHNLVELSRTITTTLDSQKLSQEILSLLRRLTTREYAELALYDSATDQMRLFVSKAQTAIRETTSPIIECPAGIAFRDGATRLFKKPDLEKIGSPYTRTILADGIRTVCCVPLLTRDKPTGCLTVGSTQPELLKTFEIELLRQMAPQIANAIDNSRVHEEVSSVRDRLVEEKVYLEEKIRDALNFEEIVGRSPSLARALDQVQTVAPSAATVLILGETGTGKELVAHAIHRLSSRASGSFVKVNCAAIPTGLLESELFGHEKGAFTGAVSQKIGRLEVADKGTLFLDEVGEIPAELQPKLLRALQDQEFERLGGNRTIRVNVRIIAATNRDLAKAVDNREFRSDLYYRLHVFPVRLPSLRERVEDIPLLVHYFVQKFARSMNKRIESIPSDAMRALQQWHWPGNIRELENFIERSVILTKGSQLRVPVGELVEPLDHGSNNPGSAKSSNFRLHGTLEDLERTYIVQVLRQSKGIIAGSHGAAARLGMKRTTLQSKIQRLHIKRDEYRR